jgi:hypothetical protein
VCVRAAERDAAGVRSERPAFPRVRERDDEFGQRWANLLRSGRF